MPHFGEIQSLVGTLRQDGIVQRVANSLITSLALGPYLLMETGFHILLEDGSGALDLES